MPNGYRKPGRDMGRGFPGGQPPNLRGGQPGMGFRDRGIPWGGGQRFPGGGMGQPGGMGQLGRGDLASLLLQGMGMGGPFGGGGINNLMGGGGQGPASLMNQGYASSLIGGPDMAPMRAPQPPQGVTPYTRRGY